MKEFKHVSKRGDIAFLYDLANVVMCSEKDIDLSIILQSDKAQYLDETIEDGCGIFRVKNDFDNEFGEVTGLCIVSIIKEGKTVQVIVEDHAYIKEDGSVMLKYHEADVLMLLDGHNNADEFIKLYEPRKTIFVTFEDEFEETASLLFS